MHTLLDLRGSIPAFYLGFRWKNGRDVRILDELVLEPGSFYVMDRGYVDFRRLYCFVLAAAFFVTRAKVGLKLQRLESQPVPPDSGVRSDQIVWLTNRSSIQHYPDKLRRVHYVDPDTDKSLVFLTNNFELPALTIAQLYKNRWKVELFFKWINLYLRIKHFYGTSDNAVKTQVWISVSVYVLVSIVKKQHTSRKSLYSILQILSVSAFEKETLQQVLRDSGSQNYDDDICNQLAFSY